MHYISNTTFHFQLNIFYITFTAIALLIHIFYVYCAAKMALEQGQSKWLFIILAFFLPEIAFILLYYKAKENNYYNYDYGDESETYYYN